MTEAPAGPTPTPERETLTAFMAEAAPFAERLRAALDGDDAPTATERAQNLEQMAAAVRSVFEAVWPTGARAEHFEAGALALHILLGITQEVTGDATDSTTVLAILTLTDSLRQCAEGTSLADMPSFETDGAGL